MVENRPKYYTPYPKQAVFHKAGGEHRERLFMAGNQLGKTWAGGFEMAMHLTGDYPDWWEGRRFTHPVSAWAAGVTGEGTRDNAQRILMGQGQQWGTGTIPKTAIHRKTLSKGLSDAVDTVYVRHRSGGLSKLSFKSYERGREKWQGETLDLVWFDEEPPADIYAEGLARITATGGMCYITFTPLIGMSEVVRRFINDPGKDRHVTRMTIDEAEHIPEEEREKIIQGYPEHEREARAMGVPMLGSGRVFPVAQSVIKEQAEKIPEHWPRICGLDFGWDHPTAAIWIAWDRDADTLHVYDVYKKRQEVPIIHAAAIKGRGKWIPVAWPHDGLQHDKGSGQQLAKIYKDQGCNMLANRAQFNDGSYGVEAGITQMLQRMQTGRFKVAEHLNDWWDEFRMYHRKDGKIVKENDDLMSATRYAVMMLRSAKTHEEHKAFRKPLEYGDMGWIV